MEAAKLEAEKASLLEVCLSLPLLFVRSSALPQDEAVNVQDKGYKKKSPWGQWVQYDDKRGRGLFYYNLVSLHPPCCALPVTVAGVSAEPVGRTERLPSRCWGGDQDGHLRHELLPLTTTPPRLSWSLLPRAGPYVL
jgi:hypothetical protein